MRHVGSKVTRGQCGRTTYAMKAYRVAEARAQLGALLDEAKGGDGVVIERKGVRFRLTRESVSASGRRPRSALASVHPDVLSGSWTWTSRANGLRFKAWRPAPWSDSTRTR